MEALCGESRERRASALRRPLAFAWCCAGGALGGLAGASARSDAVKWSPWCQGDRAQEDADAPAPTGRIAREPLFSSREPALFPLSHCYVPSCLCFRGERRAGSRAWPPLTTAPSGGLIGTSGHVSHF